MGLILILILLIYGFLGFDGHEFVVGGSGVSRKQQFGYVLRGGGSRGYLGIGFLFLFGF